MYLLRLTASQFRNLDSLDIEPSQSVNLLYGDNGSGKTNILEAIFVLLVGRSQRGAIDATMIQKQQEMYRLTGVLSTDDGTHSLSIAAAKGGRKKITRDEVAIRLSELYETTCAVAIGPEDSEFIAGPPSARRAFLDLYLSQSSRSYLFHLTRYQRALQQKNMALKQEADPEPFNHLMVEHGSEVMFAREQLLWRLEGPATEIYKAVSRGDNLKFTYLSYVGNSYVSKEDWAECFAARIHSQRHKEAAAQVSLVGPHRDDIDVLINNLPARTHSSQGEARTASIALKLAMFSFLKEIRQVTPILLLDEVFAELDADRTSRLIGTFSRFGQLFVTTATELKFELPADSKRFRISDGRIEGIA